MLQWRGPELGRGGGFALHPESPNSARAEQPCLLASTGLLAGRNLPSKDPPWENISRESPEPLTFAVKFPIFVSDVRGL